MKAIKIFLRIVYCQTCNYLVFVLNILHIVTKE